MAQNPFYGFTVEMEYYFDNNALSDPMIFRNFSLLFFFLFLLTFAHSRSLET